MVSHSNDLAVLPTFMMIKSHHSVVKMKKKIKCIIIKKNYLNLSENALRVFD